MLQNIFMNLFYDKFIRKTISFIRVAVFVCPLSYFSPSPGNTAGT